MLIKHFLYVLFVLSFSQWVSSQTEQDYFSYSLSGDLEWTVYYETPGAVAGAFYEFRENQTDVIYVILGIKGGDENNLAQKLRLTIPIPIDKYFEQVGDSLVPINNRPRAVFMATNTEYTINSYNIIRSVYTPTLKLSPIDKEGRLSMDFEFSFKNNLCIRGQFSVDINEKAESLDIFVDPKDSSTSGDFVSGEVKEAIIRHRQAYNNLSRLEKRMEEGGSLIWNGYSYILASPLVGASVTQRSDEVLNACD